MQNIIKYTETDGTESEIVIEFEIDPGEAMVWGTYPEDGSPGVPPSVSEIFCVMLMQKDEHGKALPAVDISGALEALGFNWDALDAQLLENYEPEEREP